MSHELKVPVLPESVSEATVLTWHKQPGDTIRRDENLLDLETEKIVLEVPAPFDGVLKEIIVNDGDIVEGEQLLGILEEGAVEDAAEPEEGSETQSESEDDRGDAVASPAARKILAEKGIDPASIKGTGKNGLITKSDAVAADQALAVESEAPSSAPAKTPVPAPTPVSPPTPKVSTGERTVRREPMTRMRSTIARRLKEAQNTQAMLTTFNDVNMQAVMDLRSKYKEAFEKKHNARLGYMSFFVKAAHEALKRFPAVNASIDGSDIVYHDYFDIGIAASSPRGLVVPIIRDVDKLSFAEIEQSIASYGARAKAGTLGIEDLTGGTFTITNGGVFGSMLSTPIVNPPQSAILGMHRIEKRPVAENDEVVIRPMMYLALTYDHRIIDGAEAVRFLVSIKECLEDPARLLLEI
ncbi:MAG TPA: dihydrolipoamide succinyltransferase [Gammaproteobacteria bacterium]|jgi:2-oxoglutarate dehydrogenase E2 component (dihydrolipoamide succinyltransferase)|nr:2-oxoglutarate dehydrogenase complex dihydrolipoyllysine-residue succinyltransferase [Pseudomonadota bacterium]HAY46330.1 dihydrolipoamide succinyltransferase [Gammaproteobacteria bacterium]